MVIYNMAIYSMKSQRASEDLPIGTSIQALNAMTVTDQRGSKIPAMHEPLASFSFVEFSRKALQQIWHSYA